MTITLAQDIRRSPAEFSDLIARLDVLSRTDPIIQGAWAATEWLVGDTTCSPATGRDLDVTGHLLAEAHHAAMISGGFLSGNREYGLGAEAILFWALGTQPLPWWLRVVKPR